MEIRCQIIFIKHPFWKIHELETFGTRKKVLRKKLEGCSCARKFPVVFWTFHTFVWKANQPWTATKNSSREKNTGNCMKSSKHDWTLSGTATSLQFFFKNPFPNAKSFQFMNFSEAMFYENYLTSDFHTNTVISSLFAYPSKWRRKPW